MAGLDLVVLFDIDGTLVHTKGAGVRGMNRAFDRLHGRPDALDGVPVAGRTDRSIVVDGFRRIGVAPGDDRIRELRDVYVGELPAELARVSHTAPGVLPGVVDTVAAFTERPEAAVGLLTGNFEAIARLKLQHYGLSEPFSFGGFGDHHVDRRDLLPIALERARQAGYSIAGARVVIIGDTPLDIDCAHAHGALAVAVATGTYSAGELAAAGADVLLDALGADAVPAIVTAAMARAAGGR
jgi:phosphoglycolate phosphatase-like HAD superfamily hydrolase